MFYFRARKDGVLIRGYIDAESHEEAALLLFKMGVDLETLREVKEIEE